MQAKRPAGGVGARAGGIAFPCDSPPVPAHGQRFQHEHALRRKGSGPRTRSDKKLRAEAGLHLLTLRGSPLAARRTAGNSDASPGVPGLGVPREAKKLPPPTPPKSSRAGLNID